MQQSTGKMHLNSLFLALSFLISFIIKSRNERSSFLTTMASFVFWSEKETTYCYSQLQQNRKKFVITPTRSGAIQADSARL